MRKNIARVLRGYFDDVVISSSGTDRVTRSKWLYRLCRWQFKTARYIPADTLIAKTGKALGLELVEVY